MDRSYTQKVNEEILVLNDKLEHIDLIISEEHPSKCSKINILLNTYGIVSRIHHLLGQKQVLIHLEGYYQTFFSTALL